MKNENIQQAPLGVQIRETNKVIKTYVEGLLRRSGKIPLHGMEGMVLDFIFRFADKENLTATDIAKKFSITKATVSQTLNRLELKELVEEHPLPSDGRVKIISLTKKGHIIQQDFEENFRKVNSNLESGISEEEKELLVRILERIRHNAASCTQSMEKGEKTWTRKR